MQLSDRQFVFYSLRGFVALLVLVCAVQLWADPFWAWRKQPQWLGWHKGQNWNLDIRMRSAKALQVLSAPVDTVLIGSSRTYHGFDPAGLPGSYNYGISGLRIREMEGFVSHLLRYRTPKQVVIGLDYFMFDARHRTVPGYNPAITKPLFLADALPGALFSVDALDGVHLALTGDGPREGVWHEAGFKQPFPLTADKMPEILEAQRENLGKVILDEEGYAAFARVLRSLKEQGVRTHIYISPMHPSQFALLEKDGASARFAAWRNAVRRISDNGHAQFHDFSEERFGDEDALLQTGTTAHWQDPTHFTPLTGALLLERMGVK